MSFDIVTKGQETDTETTGGLEQAATGGTVITPTLLLQRPLSAVILGPSCQQIFAPFPMATDEAGITLGMQLLNMPIMGNPAPAPIAGATLAMHLKPVGGTDIVMASTPTIIYANYAIVQMVFQATDMALLTTTGLYRGMVHATLTDGQVADFGGLSLYITSPNP